MVFTAVFTAVETTSREPSCFWFPTVAHWHSEKDVLMVSMDLNRMKLLELSINMHQLFSVQPVTSNCLDAFSAANGEEMVQSNLRGEQAQPMRGALCSERGTNWPCCVEVGDMWRALRAF